MYSNQLKIKIIVKKSNYDSATKSYFSEINFPMKKLNLKTTTCYLLFYVHNYDERKFNNKK